MASSFTGLGTELMTTGENAGTWGTTTNTNLQIIEQISGGYIEQAVTSTPTTLAVEDGDTDAVLAHRIIKFTGNISENTVVTIPLDVQQLYVLVNGTSGAYTVQFKYVSGSGSSVTFATTDKGTKIVYATADDSTNPNIVDTGISSAFTPASADGAALGSSSLEFSDLYLADSSIIYFGNDQDVTITHDPDDGLFLKSTATADDNPFVLTLQTGETDMAADDVLGKIDFQAPDEGTGTDAILVAAGIEAVSEGDFSSSNNATKLSFKTAASEAAAEKMKLSSTGVLTLNGSGGSLVIPDAGNIGSASDTDAVAISSAGVVALSATTEASATGTAALTLAGGLGVAKDVWIGDDLVLDSDSTVLKFGDDQDTTLTHTDGTGLTLNGTNKLCFYDTALSIHSSADGQLDLIADTEIQIAATTIDINGAVAMDGAITGATDITLSGELDAATLDISGNADIDGTTNLDAVDIDGAVQLDSTLTVGANDQGYDIKFFGDTASAYMLWDTSADDLVLAGAAGIDLAGDIDVDGTANLDTVDIDGNTQVDGTITVGANDQGYDIKFFGDTASAYMLWDTSADDLVLAGAAGIDLAGDIDVDGTANLDAVDIDGAVQIDNTVTVGENDTGYDVKFFGATSGAYMLWDEDTDDLVLAGASKLYLYDAGGGEYLSSSGSALTIASGSAAWELPAADGSANQYLKTDGSGNLDWASAGAAAVDSYTNSTDNRVITSVDSSTINAEANLTFDGTTLAVAGTVEPSGDTASGDNAAIGYTASEGLILTGQGSTNDVTIKNDADGDVISIPTGTTNVTIAGDLTISGDDLTMGTNTSGAALIADGTNFNPVVISGDATIAANGALTIANDAVSLAKMASGTDGNIISYDASGNPVAVATGTDGQVLTSAGAGQPCAFEDASEEAEGLDTASFDVDASATVYYALDGGSGYLLATNVIIQTSRDNGNRAMYLYLITNYYGQNMSATLIASSGTTTADLATTASDDYLANNMSSYLKFVNSGANGCEVKLTWTEIV
jgi:cytoskeletal protein CcmA (bactofilin family)